MRLGLRCTVDRTANMMEYTLTLTDETDDLTRGRILDPLVKYNVSRAGPSNSRPLIITIRNTSNETVGGLWGDTGFQWLFTQFLAVPETLRGKGLGTRIMLMAEKEAIFRGCHSAWLDTFEFQARGFYERIGYECFGQLRDYPPGFSRHFMKKNLSTRPHQSCHDA